MPDNPPPRIGDLISISPAPAVVSLTDLQALTDSVDDAAELPPELASLLGDYSLAHPDTRAAFEVMVESLARTPHRGDAFHVQGVYGAGKSHLLAVLALLVAHPQHAWPHFLHTYPEYEAAAGGFPGPRLVVPIPLDEYPAETHPLEHIVFARIEQELAARHGVRAALTEESHLLDLVDRYVVPQAGDDLDKATAAAHGTIWRSLRSQRPAQAAEAALAFIEHESFPLDWRRSRAEAWAELRRALQTHNIDGPVILLDELGTFLAGQDRRGMNADASFLQYLAQRTGNSRCWLICVTQRGLEEVGDIDGRTLRQLRDRFRSGLMLDLADIEWVVQHRVVRRHDPAAFFRAMQYLHARCRDACPTEPFTPTELAHCYPVNPACLEAIRRAAEACLSRTRSAVRLLQETVGQAHWLRQPIGRLITPDAAFDIFRSEMSMSVIGRRHLEAYEAVMANAPRVARAREPQLAVVLKTLCLLGLAGLRWSQQQIRWSLVGCADDELWQSPEVLGELLLALYRRGAYVERVRREGEEADEYYMDVASGISEKIRRRLSELVGELTPGDSRVTRAALEACREAAFPIAQVAQPQSLGVMWLNARRYATVAFRELGEIPDAELQNLAGRLESPQTREDACLFVASPTADPATQDDAWRKHGGHIEGRFSVALLAWIPGQLKDAEREHLIEHAALASMVADRTASTGRSRELRDRVRQRWTDSEAEVRRILQRTYYEGKIVGLDGRCAIERERLWGLFGNWEETLSAIFSGVFGRLFPRFREIAPDRRLVGRGLTNQIIDQFIRPGEVSLPPASTLEAHLLALAEPLGLVAGEDRHLRLALKNRDLLQAALAAAPARSRDEIDPHETIAYSEIAGRLSKSEWGLVREQSELLLAALIRAGYLVALDAFLQPVRLHQVAAPLGDSLPYVMRGAPLRGETAEKARLLWEAATGGGCEEWDLPAQERAWDEIIVWASSLCDRTPEHRAAIQRAAEALDHDRDAWACADEALARAEALARGVQSSLTSAHGLKQLVSGAERMPDGAERTAHLLGRWRDCEHFIRGQLDEFAKLHRRLRDPRVQLPNQSLLARERQAVLDEFASPEGLIARPDAVKAAAQRWLASYRRHYVAWHSRAHAPARFEELAKVRRSPAMEAARRLARAGLRTEQVATMAAEFGRAAAARCLAGDPLPEGSVVCPICRVALGEEPKLPDAGELARRSEEMLGKQQEDLRDRSGLLKKRLSGCRDEQVAAAIGELLGDVRLSADDLVRLLQDDTVLWLRKQLGQPRAQRRELGALENALRGREVTKQEVLRIVEEWLQAGEDDVVEVV